MMNNYVVNGRLYTRLAWSSRDPSRMLTLAIINFVENICENGS